MWFFRLTEQAAPGGYGQLCGLHGILLDWNLFVLSLPPEGAIRNGFSQGTPRSADCAEAKGMLQWQRKEGFP
jgi:hypothetical protein